MIVAIHQPAYLPWLGYLARIAEADVFVFLDTVQFEKNSFTNRNRIKSANGPVWLTVPVRQKGHIGKPLSALEIDDATDWRTKHLRSIEQNYRKAPRFSRCEPDLATLLQPGEALLTELCYRQLKFWAGVLDIGTRIVRASELPVGGLKSDLVLNICRHLRADRYLSGPLGRDYLAEDTFAAAGIEIDYHSYIHPVYSQLYGPFVPAMSVVDYWMNTADTKLFRGHQ
ncbi:MAG: hypothetical protein JWR51_39 [Devosia sp.]|uniref:WbqC family protein n=1 Tax=Devosia sp. TaxID=1871048 RepID=UPI00262352CA|nr:WbqC family protein [Devosia sp.]MDB5526936.1 hypothetical protein [Devosia sp.]